ncbi:DUF2637 domain-containing protein [Streptomyces sp. NPDC054884]|uniref:DUF2637 domain-containing protein n=1 Tax=Streptomyces sp. ME08-AFT2 TaxID=3028683 RepID=UPI0029A79D8C|nr:DUF2637 domain-containing protein [Streptomyces sp. ME08-AFT2]MDX3314925.1 DUF2637 domain-containing protein [Streptomyces sp. ME08-AFT2]
MSERIQLTRTHRVLIGVVVTGAVIIAGIGFAGSYAAVRELALEKGFGNFSYVFPIGIDAGICVLLALDLLLTWIRIPFPLLRQTAWLLTAATIAFNGAAAWPDPLGTGMHAVIPILFVVSVEAARHAIGRIADITADKHMEGVRITRWLLSPVPTFLLWRRMKLWELRSYDQVIKLEQERLVYQARLRSRFGRAWRRKAPVESLMPLRLARYGVPLAETAPAGLAAAGIEPALLPPMPAQAQAQGQSQPQLPSQAQSQAPAQLQGPQTPVSPQHPLNPQNPQRPMPRQAQQPSGQLGQFGQPGLPAEEQSPWFQAMPHEVTYQGGYDPTYDPAEQYADWYEEQRDAEQYADQYQEEPPAQEPSPEETGSFPIPVGPGRSRELGEGGGTPLVEPDEEAYYQIFKQSISIGGYPTPSQFSDDVEATFGAPLLDAEAKRMVMRFQKRHAAELEEDHIA